MAGFPESRRLAAGRWCNEASMGFACAGLASSQSPAVGRVARHHVPNRSASPRWLPFAAGPLLHRERAIHRADSFQSARSARFVLAHGIARRAEETPGRTNRDAAEAVKGRGAASAWRGAPKRAMDTRRAARRRSPRLPRPFEAARSRCWGCEAAQAGDPPLNGVRMGAERVAPALQIRGHSAPFKGRDAEAVGAPGTPARAATRAATRPLWHAPIIRSRP